MPNASPTSEAVEFWFDPVCPFTWVTSRFVAEVAARRGIAVQWRPFSLQILNEGREDTHAVEHAAGHRMDRVVEAARVAHSDACVGPLYTALGERLHPGGQSDIDAVIAESLAEAGLPAELLAAADREDSDAALRESTERAIRAVGPGVGIPIVAVGGNAIFGPVLKTRPTGDAADRLWDALVTMLETPGFSELKRSVPGEIEF